MQNIGTALYNILNSANRDLLDVFEFYQDTQTVLSPENAVYRCSSTRVQWNTHLYVQQAISRGDVSRFFDSKINTVTLTLSNIDRSVANFLTFTDIEGYRLVVRCISRSVDNDSLVLFVGRCERQFEVDNTTVQITAKQDLGSIDNQLPPNEFRPKCILEFKGIECLAGQSLGSKSAAFQAAATCNFSANQCREYVNFPAFQGIEFNTTTGNFKVSAKRGGAGGAILGLLGLGNKKVTKQYTSQDDSPYGKPRPLGFGRTQIELIPIVHADTGQFLAGQSVIGEGEITQILNLRNVSPSFAQTFQALATHLGKYGFDPAQDPDGFFASGGDAYSHLAYVEYTIKGTNPDTGDPAPTLVGVILWIKIAKWNGTIFTGADWSDNGPEITRYILTDNRLLNYNSTWIDTASFGATVDHCNEPLIDQTGGEDLYISNTLSNPGTDFKRYRSTGLLDTYWFRWVLGIDSAYPASREATYNTFNPASPPGSITPTTRYRRRYTVNFAVKERTRTYDFLSKSLLPASRMFLLTGADGKLQLRADKQHPTSFLRNSVSSGATALPIEDAEAWKSQTLPVFYCLVGVGLAASETARVTSIDYSTAGNSITLATSVTGSITATRSGATLTGGSSTVQASGTVTIGGTPAAGNTVTVTIDGIGVTYTLIADDTTGTVAAMIATAINANLTLNRFVKAIWSTSTPTVVTIKSKLGILNLAAGVAAGHTTAEKVLQINLPFSDVAFGALSRGNILKNSFKWPLSNRQSSFNQFVIKYADAVQDFQEQPIEENDFPHQRKINRINKFEIDGTCVDNYHQASRLLVGARYKFREGDFFCGWGSAGAALLLEEGDVVCVSHGSMPQTDVTRRNLPLKLEEVKINARHQVSLIGRLYSEQQYPDTATPTTIVLGTAINWPTAVPGAVTNLVLSMPDGDTLRGTFDFAAFLGTQTARIEIKRSGTGVYVDTGLRIEPDANNKGAFEISGVIVGQNCVKVTPFSMAGDGPSTEACFDTEQEDILQWQVFARPEPSLKVEVFS